jgi:predicted ABC-class ATPase
VRGVDLRAFVRDLPGAAEVAAFDTDDASGSTSLAASIVEAFEAGAHSLLLDEERAATNLLVRDARMQALVERETVVPLVDRAGRFAFADLPELARPRRQELAAALNRIRGLRVR